MISVTMLEVCGALNAFFEGDGGLLARLRLPPVSIDSRTIQSGECFVAIEGPRQDGHRFIGEALRKGAAAVIHSSPLAEPVPAGSAVLIRVADTTAALKTLGRLVRQRWGGRLIAVTGSMGKTTTRQFAAAILRRRHSTLESPGNLNNQYGVPLALLGLRPGHERAVLELAMNHAGEIRELGAICHPDAAALTNVAAVHLEFFPSVDAIAEAKGEILERLGAGPLVFNADDPRVVRLAARFQGPRISFGTDSAADVQIVDFQFEGLARTRFRLRIFGETFPLESPLVGTHFLYNMAAAAAIATGEGIEAGEIAETLPSLQPPPSRGTLLRLAIDDQPGCLTVLDDSYNSNPEALRSLLRTLEAATGFRRRILALGEMLELGVESERYHREAGRWAAQLAPDLLWTVGGQAAWMREAALEAGFPASAARHFDDSAAAGDALAPELGHGDLLAVKGSRGAKMDRLIERVREMRERTTA